MPCWEVEVAMLHRIVSALAGMEHPVAVVLNIVDYDRVKLDVQATHSVALADPAVSVDRIDGVPLIRAKGLRSYIVADTFAYGPTIHML